MAPLLQFPRIHFEFGAVDALADAASAALGIKRPLFVTDPGLVRCGVFAQARRALPLGNDVALFDAGAGRTPPSPASSAPSRSIARKAATASSRSAVDR